MTVLYKPVLIESAEQAEALPVGTVATHDAHMPLEKWSDPEEGATWGYLDESIEHADLVGWTALVPIEAVEEHVAPRLITYSRYVTAWEEA